MIFQLRIDLCRFSEPWESTAAGWIHFVQEHCVSPLQGLVYLRTSRFPTAPAVGCVLPSPRDFFFTASAEGTKYRSPPREQWETRIQN